MKRVALLGLVAALASMYFFVPTSQVAAQPQDVKNRFKGIPVNGRITEAGKHGTFKGTLDITSFAAEGGQLVAKGTLRGELKEANGPTRVVSSQDVTWPVQRINNTNLPQGTAQADESGMEAMRDATEADFSDMQAKLDTSQGDLLQQACQILRLVLGPLDLNILGLRVQLNQVILLITAIPGGGLLGDLLCAIANLLNQGPLAGVLGQIAELLNDILDILGGG